MNIIKSFYTTHADYINEKRVESPYALRRYAHECQYNSILKYIEKNSIVLDAGCGEGSLSLLMAQKGARVLGTDISIPNIEASKKNALKKKLVIDFRTADLENLPFEDNTFDIVVSSHVLEHIPDFDKGLREIMRVTKKRAIVAIPTIFNGCSLVQVGGSQFYGKGLRAFSALPVGFIKMIYAALVGKEGVDEQYGGGDVPHIFRFPSVMRKKIKDNGFTLIEQEAATLCLPYFETLLPISKKLDVLRGKAFFRNFGYGTTFVIEK